MDGEVAMEGLRKQVQGFYASVRQWPGVQDQNGGDPRSLLSHLPEAFLSGTNNSTFSSAFVCVTSIITKVDSAYIAIYWGAQDGT